MREEQQIMRIFIKRNNRNGICDILDNDRKSETYGKRLDVYKDTLNHFQGRQLTKASLKECIDYLHISIAAQGGSKEAQQELDRIHYLWNHHEEA